MQFVRYTGLVLLSLVIWLLVAQYLLCPQYRFTEPEPFHGAYLYNPYQNLVQGRWIQCNFHAHTNAWNGITNGRGSAEDLFRRYQELGYTVHAVSEYEKIDTTGRQQPSYVAAYEHGYNATKTHQLVLGASRVCWPDFLFPQSRANKQWMLNQLSADPGVVVELNHPVVRNGYTARDMAYLAGYQCIEVLNPAGRSFSLWDAALSAGKPVFATGNDDTHNVFDQGSLGRFCTWLYVDTLSQAYLLRSLREGKGYAMEVGSADRTSLTSPLLRACELRGDTLLIRLNRPADRIEFTGQHGKTLAVVCRADQAAYRIRREDNYVRTSLHFADGTSLYLNPVFRYGGDAQGLFYSSAPIVDGPRTLVLYALGYFLLALWLFILLRKTPVVRRFRRPARPRPSLPQGVLPG
ncbi:MAG TPA: hypothetical protein VG870_09285 [Chitinophagaceae bacterium]|nr:hypothetical protein [Chitinophagaceae bacterium]